MRGRSLVLDGEIVCLDATWRADFAALFFHRQPPVFMAFDLFKAALQDGAGGIRYVDHVRGRGHAFYELCCQARTVVAKRCRDPYIVGKTRWLKSKARSIPLYMERFQEQREWFERGARARLGISPLF